MKCDRGNILFLILLAIVLFAALTYAVTGGMAVKEDQRISSEKAQAASSSIVNYATLMENTINRLRMTNGCADTQINFQTASNGYTNSNAPPDEKCNLFSPNGGGIGWQAADPSWLAPATGSEDATYGQWFFPHASLCIVGLGSATCTSQASEKELMVQIRYVSDKVCSAINAQLNQSLAAGTLCNLGTTGKFNGTYQALQANVCTPQNNKPTGCVPSTNSYGNVFYHVLWAR